MVEYHFILLTLIIFPSRLLVGNELDLNKLTHYEIVEPIHVGLNGAGRRNRRDARGFSPDDGQHVDETAFQITGYKRTFTLHVYKKKMLFADSFRSIHQNRDGSYKFRKDFQHCYYEGYLRNRVNTTNVAISTCYGLRGVINDEDGEAFVIQPHPDTNDTRTPVKHVLYNNKDMRDSRKITCAVNSSSDRDNHDIPDFMNGQFRFSELLVHNISQNAKHGHRYRRSGNTYMKYIEVIVIMDHLEFKYHDDIMLTEHRGLEIMNYVDSYYKTINTRVVVTGLIVWNIANMARVTNSISETLSELEDYTKHVLFGEMNLKFDNAQLITRAPWGGVAGLAGMNKICSLSSSAVSQDHGLAYETANTVAHEMGHNIGFDHYKCNCSDGPCVMSNSVPSTPCKGFAACTKEAYESKLADGKLSCLSNYPNNFFQVSTCGNGLLEDGEACDCGTEMECEASNSTKCCNFLTCQLNPSAQCAHGKCCRDCKFAPQGVLCRKKTNPDCDLEEYCTGISNHCPVDFYIKDGTQCRNNTEYCYQGSCKSHDTECEELWGENAKKAEDICFKLNLRRESEWANCGKKSKDKYIKCKAGHEFCGKLHCQRKSRDVKLPKFPIMGSRRAKKTITFWKNSIAVKCTQGRTSVSNLKHEPTMTGSGVKCARNSICINHKCVNMSRLLHIKQCKQTCHNGGVCNNNGHCHCKYGYSCPYCELPGYGGSEDSGQGCRSTHHRNEEIVLFSKLLRLLKQIMKNLFVLYIVCMCLHHHEISEI